MASRVLLVLALALAMAGCAVNPVTGKHELSLIPVSQQIAMGEEQYVPSQQSQGGVYSVDKELTSYVSEVGQRLAAVSDTRLPYEFVVLNNSVPNAWALPGGKIAVNRGLLTALDNEAELAAVLGHEVVHAAAGHSAAAMQRGMLLQGVMIATTLASSDSEYGNYIVGGAQLGAQLVTQKYSRSAELEADLYGTRYMKRAGYNPEAAVTLQQTFVRLFEGQKTSWIDGLFASHPPSQERVDANEKTAEALGKTGELGTERWNEKMSYLRSRQDAYLAFDDAGQLASKKDYAGALAKIDNAIKIEPKEPRFYGLKGDILLEQKKYLPASEEFDKALNRDPGYYEYYLGRGLAYSRLGKTDRARSDLERSNQLLPTAIANNELGQMMVAAGNTNEAKGYFETAMAASGPIGQQAANSYVRLDLPDHPDKYIEAKAGLTADGELVAAIHNLAGIDVSDIAVTFIVTAAGQDATRTVSIDRIGAGQQGTISSGMRFSDADNVTAVSARVVAARAPN
ncbi:MAG: M48 family metalloprotease [Pseudomonadales bacterium]|nr:M48 family metalloprotease [Pseudomonadales bacterium]